MTMKKRLFAAVLTLTIAIVCTEGVLALAAAVSRKAAMLLAPPWDPKWAAGLPDPLLGLRPNPQFPEHDRNGFRNSAVPTRAEIVTLGDSHTYGTGVPAEATWPAQLHSMTGREIYSMAFGGYGPIHSLLFWDKALELHPSVIIEAVYDGNDLYDAFNSVYNRGQFTQFKSQDEQLNGNQRSTSPALTPGSARSSMTALSGRSSRASTAMPRSISRIRVSPKVLSSSSRRSMTCSEERTPLACATW